MTKPHYAKMHAAQSTPIGPFETFIEKFPSRLTDWCGARSEPYLCKTWQVKAESMRSARKHTLNISRSCPR